MLSKETQEKLVAYGFDVSKLEEAIKSEEETSLEVPTLFTEKDKEGFISEEEKEQYGKNRFEEGKKAIEEITSKELSEEFGVEKTKDIRKLIKAVSKKEADEAGKKPGEKEEKLKEENEALKKKLTDQEAEFQSKENEYKSKLFDTELTTEISQYIPEKTVIPKEDLVALFKNRYRVSQTEDGKTVVQDSKGNIIKDKVLNPVPVKDVVSQFSETYLSKEGMGGKDQKTNGSSGKFSKMSEFQAYCKANDIDPMSDEGQNHLLDNKAEQFDYSS